MQYTCACVCACRVTCNPNDKSREQETKYSPFQSFFLLLGISHVVDGAFTFKATSDETTFFFVFFVF